MSSVLCSSVCEAGLDTGLVTALAHSHRRAGAGGGRGRGGESMTKVKISSYRQNIFPDELKSAQKYQVLIYT